MFRLIVVLLNWRSRDVLVIEQDEEAVKKTSVLKGILYYWRTSTERSDELIAKEVSDPDVDILGMRLTNDK